MPEIKSGSRNPEPSRFSLFGLVDDGCGLSDGYGLLAGFHLLLVGGGSYLAGRVRKA
jgi:hypothetical protein